MKTEWSATGWVEKPLNEFSPFLLTYLSTKVSHEWLHLQVSGLNIQRWWVDGSQLRIAPGFLIKSSFSDTVHAQFRFSPLVFLNQMETRADGSSLPEYGILESIGIDVEFAPILLSTLLTFEQTFRKNWKNKFGYTVQAEYVATELFCLGLGIENENFLVNESTGLAQSDGFLDLSQLNFFTFFKVKI